MHIASFASCQTEKLFQMKVMRVFQVFTKDVFIGLWIEQTANEITCTYVFLINSNGACFCSQVASAVKRNIRSLCIVDIYFHIQKVNAPYNFEYTTINLPIMDDTCRK